MSPEKQRIEIAKASGWKCGTRSESSFADPSKTIQRECWINPNGISELRLPDYLDDLNAMHEAEKTLTEEQWGDYRSMLEFVLGVDRKSERLKQIKVLQAAAFQRAEAFLRTLELWEECK